MNAVTVANDVLDIEVQALKFMKSRLDEQFDQVVDLIINSTGRVVICSIGKSCFIGEKISASLNSTGTPSLFISPEEIDNETIGMFMPNDIFMLLSNSGETTEMLGLLSFLKENKNHTISMTTNSESTLARHSDFHLNVAVPFSSFPHQVAPTSSLMAVLAMGDALTIATSELRKAKSHRSRLASTLIGQ